MASTARFGVFMSILLRYIGLASERRAYHGGVVVLYFAKCFCMVRVTPYGRCRSEDGVDAEFFK